MATVTQAYQFALDPTAKQRRALASHCGAARVAYNWGLALVKARLDQHKVDPSIPVPWTLPELRRDWNRTKHQVAPWWAENSKEAYSSGLDGVARALRNWSDSRSGRRKGRPVGFPRFKKKGRARDTCRFTTGAIKVLPDRKHIQLPRIGILKSHSRRANWPAASSKAPPASSLPPSAVGPTAGSSPSPSRFNGTSRPPTAEQPLSAWMWASTTSPCCRPARFPLRTLAPWRGHYGRSAGSTGSWPVDGPGRGEGI